MHDAVQHPPVPRACRRRAEHAASERGPVYRWRCGFGGGAGAGAGTGGGVRREEKVWRCGSKVAHDGVVAACARLDGLARELVSVDVREGVRRRGEDFGYGRFSRREGAGESN